MVLLVLAIVSALQTKIGVHASCDAVHLFDGFRIQALKYEFVDKIKSRQPFARADIDEQASCISGY